VLKLNYKMLIKNEKNGTTSIGIAIIIFSILFLLSSSFINLENNNNSNKDSKSNNYPEDNYVFFLNNTLLGVNNIEIESYPNIEIGSPIKREIIYKGSSFKLYSNFLSSNFFTINVPKKSDEEIKYFLVYGKVERETGDNDIIIKFNGNNYYEGKGDSNSFPIVINPNNNEYNPINKTTNTSNNNILKFQIVKPKFFQIWDWNNVYVKDLTIIKVKKDLGKKTRNFNFYLQKDYLKNVYLSLTVDCQTYEDNSNVKVNVNGYDITNIYFDCDGRYNTKEVEIPLDTLKNNNNLTFTSDGYVKLSYNIKKVYYNDKFKYKFEIYNFKDITDILIYGDFNKDEIDLRINDRLITLKDKDFMSIIDYIKYGVNEIEILEKPLDIKELYIEKDYWY